MKIIKPIVTILILTLVIGAFAGCSKFEYDNSTIVAQVTAIDGQKVTLTVGEMAIDENMMQGDSMALPAGDGSIQAMPNGEMPEPLEGEAIPELPDGDMPQMPEDGSMPEMPNGELPKDFENGVQPPFTAGDDSITLTLNEETVGTLSVGSIVRITFGDNGSVESLTVLGGNMQGGFGGNMTPPTDPPRNGSGDEEISGNGSDDTNS